MAVRKPFKLSWEGVEYSIIVNMTIIDRIDEELNILSLARMSKPENVRLTKIAKLIFILLDEAGANVTYEAVYDGMNDAGKMDQKAGFAVVGAILPQLLPSLNGVAKKKPASRKPRPKKPKK